ncbi:hypothetical protein [Psychromarinibacter sediminicola]|nr:hypothetical protein [Psychromarinibacter sediminicola]
MKRCLAALLLLPGPALAQAAPDPAGRPEGFAPMEGVEYYCTDADGARHEIGAVICITAGCDTWLARCGMSLNNPTWRWVQDGCPGVSLHDRLKLLQPPV